MFLVREGEKLAFHHVQNQSGKEIFHPFLFHQAKPPNQEKGFSIPLFHQAKPPNQEKGFSIPLFHQAQDPSAFAKASADKLITAHCYLIR
jgi:hypothetical protein